MIGTGLARRTLTYPPRQPWECPFDVQLWTGFRVEVAARTIGRPARDGSLGLQEHDEDSIRTF